MRLKGCRARFAGPKSKTAREAGRERRGEARGTVGAKAQADRLMHSLTSALCSSPFFPAACLLQAFFLSCCAVLLASSGLPDRQVGMNARRSSPLRSPTSLLQVAIFSCCAVLGLSAACAPLATKAAAHTRERTMFL